MNLTPKQIVYELDKYIIGQEEAKKAVAIALRNRYRRSMLSDAEREEIKSVYKIIYEESNNVSDALRIVDELYPDGNHAKVITDFIRASKRGICKRGGSSE